ncbi:MAG TPA: choice-of-anchor V domain-containing protein, partial [Longimicrobiales bacterium]|nr:choice-of-anchor V domain-containing protein [Longimicrobiales bacterium]
GAASAVVCMTCSMLLGSAVSGRAGRDRPPPAHTGGFSEPLCTACHFQAAVNEGSGTLTIDGLPAAYQPATAYTLTVTIAQEYLAAGGFQMAARFDDGTQAGTFSTAPSDSARVDVTAHEGVQYIHHAYDGTPAVAPDTARWQVVWTAPREGAVVFHAAANAADDDFSPMGDMIYAVSLRTSPASSAKQQP